MERFEKLYEIYKLRIYKYFLYRTKNNDIASDLLSETFLQAFKSIDKFEGRSSFNTWLFAIANNIYKSHLRDIKKHNTESFEQLNFEVSDVQRIDDTLISNESIYEIFENIDKLDEKYKEVIVLKVICEMSYADISKLLNKRESSVRVLFHRGKEKLSAYMERV